MYIEIIIIIIYQNIPIYTQAHKVVQFVMHNNSTILKDIHAFISSTDFRLCMFALRNIKDSEKKLVFLLII